jgi:hypothetical protein
MKKDLSFKALSVSSNNRSSLRGTIKEEIKLEMQDFRADSDKDKRISAP